MPQRVAEDDTPNRSVVTKSTVFHRAVFYGAMISAFAVFTLPRELTLLSRAVLSVIAGVGGFLHFFVVVFFFVCVVMIPRVRRGSFWEYEVDCYMRSVIGTKWDQAGRGTPDV